MEHDVQNFETEEQQIEAIKKWWRDNSKLVIAVAIMGLGSILGLQTWNQHKMQSAQMASMEYDQLSLDASLQQDQKNKLVQTMQGDYPGSPYAALAALRSARDYADQGDLAAAQVQLQWVADHSSDVSIKHLANLRLASVLSAQGKNEEALKLLETDAGEFRASYLELKGDILAGLDRINEARAAYDEAMLAYAALGANIQVLRIKRNDLGNS